MGNKEEKPATETAEQAADFAALESMAEESEPGKDTGSQQQEPEQNLADEIASMVLIAVATLKPIFPSLEKIYTKETTQAAATSIAGVCDKHGWLQGGLMGKWGEEIACMAIVAPLAFATYQGVNADMEKAKSKAKLSNEASKNSIKAIEESKREPEKTVTFGNQTVKV